METNKTYEHWMNCKWRPAAAWTYIAITVFDFVISPIVFSWFQYSIGQPITQWAPLTLQGSGLFHISFGAIVGISAWTRTIEKIKVGDEKNRRNTHHHDEPYQDYQQYQHPYEDR